VLAAVDVLSRDLRRGCTVWPDVTGYTYDRDDVRDTEGRILPRVRNARWQRDLLEYLRSGQAVILGRAGTGLSAASRAKVHAGGLIATVDDWHVWAVDPTSSTSR
jgi:hypothetical protein